MSRVGENIRKYRQKKGMSLQDLANELKVQRQTIYKYENDVVTNIPIDRIKQLSAALDVTPVQLTGWNDSRPRGQQKIHLHPRGTFKVNQKRNQAIKIVSSFDDEKLNDFISTFSDSKIEF